MHCYTEGYKRNVSVSLYWIPTTAVKPKVGVEKSNLHGCHGSQSNLPGQMQFTSRL